MADHEHFMRIALDEAERGIAELIIGKHRNGPTGTVKLKFWNAWTRFDNLAEEG